MILAILLTRYIVIQREVLPLSNKSSVCDCESLEPPKPQNIDDPPFNRNLAFPLNTVPISTVITQGEELPVTTIYDNPLWQRQAYKYYWHSSYSRWSYVPYRIHYAMHKVFATYATASIYYDFVHNLGIEDEYKDFAPYDQNSVFDYVQIVVMDTTVEKIYVYKEQLVIVGRPGRTGLQTLIVPSSSLNPTSENKTILIQLSTLTSDEIDYTLINIPSVDYRP